MNEYQIREQLQQVQLKWHTPASKIAKDINIHQSLVARFINDNMQEGVRASKHLLKSLENWLLERK